MNKDEEIKRLKQENANMKEQLNSYIPRRRVRRVFKSLKAILEQDIQDDNKIHIRQLKDFIYVIEKEGSAIAGQDIKTAIEHLIGAFEINDN